MTVQDLAPVGHDRQHGGAVALGLCRQILMAQHLQGDHAGHDQPEGHQHRQARHHNPEAEPGEVGFDVLDLGHGDYSGRFASGSGARRCGASRITLANGHRIDSNTGVSR